MNRILIISLLLFSACSSEVNISDLKPPIVVVHYTQNHDPVTGEVVYVFLSDSSNHIYKFYGRSFIGMKKGDTLAK